MNWLFVAGVGLTLAGVVGYLLGTGVAYPGRAFSVTAVMLGLTVAAVGRATPSEDAA